MANNGTLTVWTDFLCPWARIGAHWILNVAEAGGLDLELEFKTFSLENINLPEDASADELWSTAPERRGLYPAAAAKWIQTNASESTVPYWKAMFDARHVSHEKIGQPDVTEKVLNGIGLDGGAIVKEITDDPKWLAAARADHDEANELGVFGVPTFVFPDNVPAFVRLLEITEGSKAVAIFNDVKASATNPTIHELKRPSLRR
jgi:predicted DsbA family dithiol-disulfide isomerase